MTVLLRVVTFIVALAILVTCMRTSESHSGLRVCVYGRNNHAFLVSLCALTVYLVCDALEEEFSV